MLMWAARGDETEDDVDVHPLRCGTGESQGRFWQLAAFALFTQMALAAPEGAASAAQFLGLQS
jgi:hypothetical protein